MKIEEFPWQQLRGLFFVNSFYFIKLVIAAGKKAKESNLSNNLPFSIKSQFALGKQAVRRSDFFGSI